MGVLLQVPPEIMSGQRRSIGGALSGKRTSACLLLAHCKNR
jgi:hypothetical protein